mgnify:FL=1
MSRARQTIADWAIEEGYELLCRVDDDTILHPDYLERLLKVLDQGYDLASGITAPFGPPIIRNPKYLKGIVNRVILDID